MSGHSKWANIKHKKAATDSKRGKVFTRLSKEITIAARLGGGDSDCNPRLRLAIQSARAVNMPMENIKRATQKGTGEIAGVSYDEVTYEGFAPCGVSVIVEAATDNRNRAVAEIRSMFNKLGGNLGESGSVSWNFTRKGAVYVDSTLSEDEMLEQVMEAEADDMQENEGGYIIYCATDMLAKCEKYFEEKKFAVKEAKFEYLPNQTVKIDNLEDARRILKFIDTVEDYEDTQNVFANFDIDDEIADQI